MLRHQGRDAQAVRVLEALEDPPPAHVQILARIAFDHGNVERAAALYEGLLARVPAANGARRELADLYDALGRREEAVALYDELIAVDPSDAALRVDRGATLFRLGRLAEAEVDYRVAVERDDRIPEVYFNLGLLDLERGRDGNAEQHLLRAVELRPDFAKAHFHLARVYRRRGDPRAAEHAERAARASGTPAGSTQPLPPVSAFANPGADRAGQHSSAQLHR
jgi:tetratricopeptide (TPR) repeat protein